MSTIFGPVYSRRLGWSLGIDPVPSKTCNYNCVYCQLGRTRPLQCERRDFFEPEALLAEVEPALARCPAGSLDVVTIVGQGEPLLYKSIDRLVHGVKRLTRVPVAIITNGSLLADQAIQEQVVEADIVLPSLDAPDQNTFRRVNRPHPALRIDRVVDGLAAFRRRYTGQIRLEVMLVHGLNDGERTLMALGAAAARICPDRIDINLPVRPPAERWVKPPEDEALVRALAIFGEVARTAGPAEAPLALDPEGDLEQAIVDVACRHPIRQDDLLSALPGRGDEIGSLLASLLRAERLRRVEYRGTVFWLAGNAEAAGRTN